MISALLVFVVMNTAHPSAVLGHSMPVSADDPSMGSRNAATMDTIPTRM